MVSLVDIVPQTRTVQLADGSDLVLRGLGLRQIAELLLRFPLITRLRRLLADDDDASENIATLILTMPDAVGAIIAEASGQPEAADGIADEWPLDDIVVCLIAVRDLTMPGGPVPFLDQLAALLGLRPSGRAPATTSPPMPNGSLPQDTTFAP